jgi:hypothetical protein
MKIFHFRWPQVSLVDSFGRPLVQAGRPAVTPLHPWHLWPIHLSREGGGIGPVVAYMGHDRIPQRMYWVFWSKGRTTWRSRQGYFTYYHGKGIYRDPGTDIR